MDLMQELDNFFSKYSLQKYKKRSMILSASDAPSSVFYIDSGYLRVFRISEQGEELTLAILKPKDFFPLTYGINGVANPYYLEAITQLSLWKAPARQFVDFIKNNPHIYFTLTQQVLVRFDGFLTRMEYLVFNNAYTKVAAMLLSCAQRFGRKEGEYTVIQVPLTHKDIATLIGLTRETTSLEMKKLEKSGLIAKMNRLIAIHDIELLQNQITMQPGDNTTLSHAL